MSGKRKMEIIEIGEKYELRREQWKGNVAYISKDPELLNEVNKLTWTYYKGDHPYLMCSKSRISLHAFVLNFLYGKEHVKHMIEQGNIIEHLDNNGLNCTYENLHIISDDWNKAKAFSIDKMSKKDDIFPAYCTDVYYDHSNKMFQIQIVMTKNIFRNQLTGIPLERILCKYNKFDDLFIDWIYILGCKKQEYFEIEKLHANRMYVKERLQMELTPEERERLIILRDGQVYINLDVKTKDGNRPISIIHTPFEKVNDMK